MKSLSEFKFEKNYKSEKTLNIYYALYVLSRPIFYLIHCLALLTVFAWAFSGFGTIFIIALLETPTIFTIIMSSLIAIVDVALLALYIIDKYKS